MIHIVIDTTVYRSNPARDNLSFQAIEKLANAGWLKLHIPYVVEREFQTQQRDIYSKDLKKAQSGLNDLLRKQFSPSVQKKIKLLKKNWILPQKAFYPMPKSNL